MLGFVLFALCAIAAAVLTWPQFFNLERTFPVAQLVAFRGLVVVGFGAAVVLFLLLTIARPLRVLAASLAALALVGGLVNAAVLYGRGIGADALPVKGEASVRVMTWNTAGDATSADVIARTAVAMEADIVALPETTIETGEQVALAMRTMEHPMWAHHTEYGSDGWDASSTTLLIAPELGDYSVIPVSQDGTSNVPTAIAMPVSGVGPTVVAAHAVAPRQSYMQDWRDDLQWLADQCGSGSVIMAGDFNATNDHMAELGIEGGDLGRCHDAATDAGSGAVGTWSTRFPALLGAPIDHVMTTPDWEVTGSVVLRSLDESGSDHRPLVVQLEPAPPAPVEPAG